MAAQLQLLPGAIAEILASVAETGILSLGDRYGLMAASMDDTLVDILAAVNGRRFLSLTT